MTDGSNDWQLCIAPRTGDRVAILVGASVSVDVGDGVSIAVDSEIWDRSDANIVTLLRQGRDQWVHLQNLDAVWGHLACNCEEEIFCDFEDDPTVVKLFIGIQDNPLAPQEVKIDCHLLLLKWEEWKTNRDQETLIESPIEQAFWQEWLSRGLGIPLTPQHKVFDGKYRIDFAHLPSHTAIELDSFQWHHNRKQFAKDRKRERELQQLGWRVIRFSGQEIHENVGKCVDEAVAMIGTS